MDWQTILMIVVAALLLFVWLPILIISVRRTLRKSRNPHSGPDPARHSRLDPARHSGLDPESHLTKNE